MLKKITSAILAVAIVAAMSTTVFASAPVDTAEIKDSKDNKSIVFITKENVPVSAAKDGRIVYADYNGSYGFEIRIEHEDGFTSAYFHLDKAYFVENKVEIGTVIKAGDVIGKTGESGRTNGNKCGFKLIKSSALKEAGKSVKSADLESTEQINNFLKAE